MPEPEQKEEDRTLGIPVEQDANLYTIGGGVSNEMFCAARDAVLNDIRDPNTEATAPRRIVMTYVFDTTEDRDRSVVHVFAEPKLAKSKPSGDVIYIGRQDGRIVGKVMQPKFDPTQDPRQGILPLERKGVVHGQ